MAPRTPPAIAADGRCSLIEAIENANADFRVHDDCVAGSGADLVRLPSRSRQILETDVTLPTISSVIRVEGLHSVIRRRQHGYFPEMVNVASGGNLTLDRTVISGDPLEPADSAPGTALVRNEGGVLSLVNSSVVDASTGAGIENLGGHLSLRRSTVSGNGADTQFYGRSGIRNVGGGTAVLVGSEVVENGAPFRGGGIFNGADSSVTLVNSTVARNRITYEGVGAGILNSGRLVLVGTTVEGHQTDFGAGVYNDRSGIASLVRSTVSGNAAFSEEGGSGGAVSNYGSMWITNSTVTGNRAEYGGGVANGGTLVLSNSTITDNSATVLGGGLVMRSGTARLVRSIISGNRVEYLPGHGYPGRGREILGNILYFGSGDATVISNNYNVIGHDGDPGTDGFEPGPTDIVPDVSISGILLPLAHNGGPTLTHALAMESPALNASPHDEDCEAVDQRQNLRPRYWRCDVGAFEGSAALCNGEVTTMVGTPGDDFLRGTPGRDVISGLAGGDLIGGLEGDDVVCAGRGWDRVWGGPGNDLLYGGDGNDKLFGNRDSDTMNGGAGYDHCDGGPEGVGGDIVGGCESINNVP